MHHIRFRTHVEILQDDSVLEPNIEWLSKQFVKKQQQIFGDDTLGGALSPPMARGDVIELMRARMVMTDAGAMTIPLPPTGQLSWARETTAKSKRRKSTSRRLS